MKSLLSTLPSFLRRVLPTMAEEGQEIEGVFAQNSFAIIRGEDLNETVAAELEDQITLHGGEIFNDQDAEELDLSQVSYVITTTHDFPEYHRALDQYKHVVKPGWVQDSIAQNKLAHPRRFSPDPNLIMADVVATCVGLPEGDKDAIVGGIIAMGGNYSLKLTNLVTHVVALDTDNDPCQTVLENELDMLIVVPHWFDACLKLGRRVEEVPFLLPGADLVDRPTDGPPVDRSLDRDLAGASAWAPPDLSEFGQRKPVKVFTKKRVLLDQDLDLSPSLRAILTDIITSSKGKVVEDVSKASVLICKYRESTNFIPAFKKDIEIGSISWLYYLIVHDKWTSPYNRLLHFPISQTIIPGFENTQISLSNYGGEARTFLENLIEATGSERTKTLKAENTHLITAHTKSEKVSAAQEWNVCIVNHLWVEESYAKWELQSVTKPKYTQFPNKVHLGEVVGQTQIDRSIIKAKFGGGDPAAIAKPDFQFASSALDSASPSRANSRAAQPAVAETPVAARMGKENLTPVSTSRKSKEAAAAKLHDMTTDIALYQKELKRAGGVVYGGRKSEDRVGTTRKRSAEPADDISPKANAKKARTVPAPGHMRLMISKYQPWTDKPKKEDTDVLKLKNLGIIVVTDPSTATALAAPNIVRTTKFLCGLAYVSTILSTKYIDACLEQNRYLDPKDYALVDKVYEKKHGLSLQQALENGKKNKQQLFANTQLFCVEKLPSTFDVLSQIAQANGAALTPYRGRPVAMSSNGESKDVLLITGDAEENKRLWPKFINTAQEYGRTPRVVNAEWLLSSALRQQVLPLKKYEM